MASSTAIKAASGLGMAGAIGGGGVALYKSELFKTQTTLGELVKNDKWTLLTASNTSQIDAILTAYKKESPKPTHTFDGFTGKENDAKEKLLAECQKASNTTYNDSEQDTLLKKIKKWCVVPKTVSQRLKDLNLTTLDTKAPSDSGSETAEWIEKGKSHHKDSQKIQGVTTNGTEATDAKLVREECAKKNEINSYDESFEESLEISRKWCTA
ncbi:hypothetical protein HF1_13020 [Mycoplasma haemofelis str. Langford 1]|uniref:Uncharacterized protein n=1 Tax=Mycoplasma haemofelis (strain Langford 1) TaxID=941640 RepID=E8ZJI9_MYCHL|nr:hypothetical protein [Mycoplasma haemofelis]CBY93310.1 hypothetical protein HF1_13020 [Mycoplasma haemofelis str. Langford 1]